MTRCFQFRFSDIGFLWHTDTFNLKPFNLLDSDQISMLSTIFIVLVTSGLYYFIIYPLYFHPLSKIPGPRICAITKYFILYKSWNEQRNRYVNKLHEKYGSIVRIGPNEIDISDNSYLKDIYVKNFDKTSFYENFKFYGEANTFALLTKKEHIESKKVSHKYLSKSSICNSTNIMAKINHVMNDVLIAIDKNKDSPMNVYVLFCAMAMDVVNTFSFGLRNYDSLLADPFNYGKKIIFDFRLQSSMWFWVTQMPQYLSFATNKQVANASQRCFNYVERQFDKSLESLKDDDYSEDNLINVYYEFDKYNDKIVEKSPVFNTLNKTKSEIYDFIAAGHVTVSVALSYLFYELAKNPEMQSKIQTEILNNLSNGNPILSSNYDCFDYKLVDDELKLPYTHAVILETLRVHTPGPGQEPRIVPTKGLVWNGNSQTPKLRIPGGTTVVMQPYSLHKNHDIFPNPDVFIPERWINVDDGPLKLMKDQLLHFGSGARMCVGQNLATIELKIMVTSLLSRYKFDLVDGFDYDHKSELLDMYVSIPRTGEMALKLTPLL